MKSVIKFLVFLIYTLAIFMLEDYLYLAMILIFNLSLMLILKISFIKWIKTTIKMNVIIVITITFNILLADLVTALMVGTKLFLVFMATYIFSNIFSYTELTDAIEYITYPTKILGVNPKDIGLIVSIGIAFIPILREEFQQIREVLVVKGFDMKFFHLVRNLNLIFKPFFISVLQRVNELEYSLKSKAYQE